PRPGRVPPLHRHRRVREPRGRLRERQPAGDGGVRRRPGRPVGGPGQLPQPGAGPRRRAVTPGATPTSPGGSPKGPFFRFRRAPAPPITTEMTTRVRGSAMDAVEGGRGTLPAFVGREADMQELHQAWRRAFGGKRQVVLLAGEPGMGKTTLVDPV